MLDRGDNLEGIFELNKIENMILNLPGVRDPNSGPYKLRKKYDRLLRHAWSAVTLKAMLGMAAVGGLCTLVFKQSRA